MPNPTAEIILTTSRHLGLVAITHGEKYQQANRALEDAGFARLPNGASTAPLTDPQAPRRTASALVHHAHAHSATITTSTRPSGGPAALSTPTPRLLSARPAPLPAPRSADRSQKGFAPV